MRIASLHTYPIKGCHGLDHEEAEVQPWGLAGDRRWLVVDDADGRAVTQREVSGLVAARPSIVDGTLRLRAEATPHLGASGSGLPVPGLPELVVPEPGTGRSADLVPVTVHRDTLLATPAGPPADAWFTRLLDRKVRLVWLDDPTRRIVDPRYARPADRVSFADAYPVLLTNTASLDALNGCIHDGGSAEGPLPMNRFRPNVVVTGAAAWAEDGWLGRKLRIGAVTFRVVKACDRCVVTTTHQQTGVRGHEPLRTLGRHRNVDQKLLFGVNLIPDAPGHITVGDPVEMPVQLTKRSRNGDDG